MFNNQNLHCNMKRIAYIFLLFFLIKGHAFAQGEVDALKYSHKGLHGTARSMSMGGAFGALGGDQTAISINPAGIGVYRSSEVAGTLGLSEELSTVGSNKSHINKFNFDNLGFIGYFPLRSNAVPMINFGFTFNRQKSFDKYIVGTGSPNNSLLDYIVDRTNKENNETGISPDALRLPEEGENLPDPFNTEPWLSVLAYNSYLIDSHQDNIGYFYTPLNTHGQKPVNKIITNEQGYVDDYDFTIGTSINGVLNLGIGLTVSNINYGLKSDYLEDYTSGGYTLTNWRNTKGAGFGAKFGAIFRPINQIRLGLSYHTPRWYALTETYEAEIVDDMGDYITDPLYTSDVTFSARFSNYYNLTTPGKLVASAAFVLGNSFIASLDYELVNYKNMKLSVPNDPDASEEQQKINDHWYDVDNDYIQTDFKSASTVKAGIEYRFTPQFSGRLGYAWMQNPYETKFKKEGNAAVDGSNTIYRMEGDANYFTGGFGYRFNRNFFLDVALVYKTQTDDLYPFPSLYTESGEQAINGSPLTLKNNTFRGLVTLGYKF